MIENRGPAVCPFIGFIEHHPSFSQSPLDLPGVQRAGVASPWNAALSGGNARNDSQIPTGTPALDSGESFPEPATKYQIVRLRLVVLRPGYWEPRNKSGSQGPRQAFQLERKDSVMTNALIDSRWPQVLQKGLKRFCEQMQTALGENLLNLVVYGPLVEEELAPDRRVVNMLVVLKEISLESLDQASQPVQEANRTFELAVLILSKDELYESTDVFPIKFLNMQRHHRVLFGEDVLTDLTISRKHLRLRCEQELKNLMLRLHRFYLDRNPYPEHVERTLTRAISALVQSLGVLVELKLGTVPATREEVIAKAAEIGLDAEPLKKCLALDRGTLRLNPQEMRTLYGSFMQTVHHAATLADQLEEKNS